MFGFFAPKLEIQKNIVTISNIPAKIIEHTLRKLYKTSRISNYLFHRVRSDSISFHEFFVLEFYFLVNSLINDSRQRVNVKKLKLILNLLSEQTWLANTFKTYPDIVDFKKLSLFKYTPIEYQMNFMKFYNKTVPAYGLKGMLLAAAPGTGKTFTSLALSECLGAERIIVICPNNALHTVWLKSTVGKDSLYIKDESVWSSASKKPYNGEKIVIFHYEALGQLEAMLPKLSQYKCALILDESHNFNELKSLRTNTFIEICKAPFIKDIIYSSGSPVKALAIETVPLLSVMDPLFTAEVRALFTRLFAGEATRLSEVLQRRLSVLSYKVDKSVLNREKPVIEDILVKIPNGDKFTLTAIATEMEAYTALRREQIKRELPETTKFYEAQIAKVTDIVLNGRVFSSEFKKQFKINLETYRRYVKAIREGGSGFNLSALKEELVFCNRFEKETIMANIESKADRDKFKDAKTIMKYPDLKIRGECLGRILGKSRIEAINAMIPHIDYADLIDSTEKKTLVFTSFVDVVVRLDAFLKKDGYNPLLVYADFTADLNNIVKRFEAKEELNPLIATYASLSTAVPLVMADTIIVMNPPFRDYIMQQTIARVDRLGATTQTRIFNIILDTGDVPNISSRNVDIIEWSRRQSDAILGISVPTEEDELSITIEQLIEAHETKQHDPLLSVSNPLVTW